MNIRKISRVVPVLQTTQKLFISHCCFAEDGYETYKNLERTCIAIVLLIKSFVWWLSRCRRRRRGLLKFPLLKIMYLSSAFKQQLIGFWVGTWTGRAPWFRAKLVGASVFNFCNHYPVRESDLTRETKPPVSHKLLELLKPFCVSIGIYK